MQSQILGISGSPIKDSNTDRLVQTVLHSSGLESDNDSLFGLVIADVSGHGISAALIMTATRALLKSQVELIANPSETLTSLNHYLCQITLETGNFVIMLYLIIHLEKNLYIGHELGMNQYYVITQLKILFLN